MTEPRADAVLVYEVPDRGSPRAQELTARLEALARRAGVALVAEPDFDPASAPPLVIRVAQAARVPNFEKTEQSVSIQRRRVQVVLADDGAPGEHGLVFVPLGGDRVAGLVDLASALLDARGPDHPLLSLPPGTWEVAIAALPELVPDLAGTLSRRTLARLTERLRGMLDARPDARHSELSSHAGAAAFPGPAPHLDQPTADPGAALVHSLGAWRQAAQAEATRALTELDEHLRHRLAAEGLAALRPLERHLAALRGGLAHRHVESRPPLDPTPTASEVELAQAALTRARTSVVAPPEPGSLTLAFAHGPLAAGLGGLALTPLLSALAGPTALAELGGPALLAGLAASGLFVAGYGASAFARRLARAHGRHRLARAEAAFSAARAAHHTAQHQTHAHRAVLPAARRYEHGLAERAAALAAVRARVEALGQSHASPPPESADPRDPTRPFVAALSPPIEPWIDTIQGELARDLASQTLLSIEGLVADELARRGAWQGRADLAQALLPPAHARLESLAHDLAGIVPASAGARRLALVPKALGLGALPAALTGFDRAHTHAGLYTLALIPRASHARPA